MEKFALYLFEKESHCRSKRCGFFLHSGDESYGASPDALWLADIMLEIKMRAKSCSSPLQSLKGKGSYFLQAQQQMQCTGESFCILMFHHPESNTAKYFIIKGDDTLFFVCKSMTDSILENK